ncbi:unnamed protein product [Symbiodinium natans]|uniref:Tyrosine-protein kinase ephrin type A/B receptor-like domain-containing protein n=1 Tax=Symbiodinium natans TaxID=878477 RepID=A0A812QAT2_9DINO|nr:unnamed protein product [Symbiodinium natans]
MSHQSALTGFSATEFGDLYRSKYKEDPPYQAVAAFAAIVSLGRAVELANSTEPAEVSAQLQALDIETLYGRVAFDEHGQIAMELKAVQVQEVGMPPVPVSPLGVAVAPLRLMPTMAERQCASEAPTVYGSDASGNCVRCPASSFSMWNTSTKLRRCIFCPAGSSLDEEGVCSFCAPGKVSITAGQRACTNCSEGYYADSVGQSRCRICPVGTFSGSSGLTQCTNCSAGTFNNEAAHTSCRNCTPGTISTEEAATHCDKCSLGQYAADNGMTSCSQCQAGFTTSSAGASGEEQCVCPKDSFRDGDSCVACGFLQTTLLEGALSSDACRLTDDAVWLVVSMTAAMLLFMAMGPALVLAYTKRIRRRLEEAEARQRAVLESKVKEGVDSITELAHPMVITRADTFLDISFEQIQMLHEGARDRGILTFLDSKASIQVHRKQHPRSRFVFLSYQWLSWNVHGPNEVQFEAMQKAVIQYADAMRLTPQEVYVWLDVLSIPQLLAVNSLFTYASAADSLIIIAPRSTHAETGEARYLTHPVARTRMEQIAHVTAHSIDTMGLARYAYDLDVPLPQCFMTKSRQGQNLTLADEFVGKETLVIPLLGVWFVLRSWMDQQSTEEEDHVSHPGASLVYRLMRDQMDSVFPKTFEFNTLRGSQQRAPWIDLKR